MTRPEHLDGKGQYHAISTILMKKLTQILQINDNHN